MKTVNSVSGGKTSAYMAVHYPADLNLFACVCIDEPKAKPKDLFVQNYALNKLNGNFIASAESDQTLKALIDLEQILGKEIVWTRGKSFDEIIKDSSYTRLPSWARRYCTLEMKLKPCFEYMLQNGFCGALNNIGFRFDEKYRVRKFYYDKDGKKKNPHFFYTPDTCNIITRRQKFKNIYFRHARFPLVRDQIDRKIITDFWKDKPIEFPVISNCVGCFHKDPIVLNKMFKLEPEKMQWFVDAEKITKQVRSRKTGLFREKSLGTWLYCLVTYEDIKNMNFTLEIDFNDFPSCDSGGCTD
jgi:hypothetical protein